METNFLAKAEELAKKAVDLRYYYLNTGYKFVSIIEEKLTYDWHIVESSRYDENPVIMFAYESERKECGMRISFAMNELESLLNGEVVRRAGGASVCIKKEPLQALAKEASDLDARNNAFRVREEALRYKNFMFDEDSGIPEVEELKRSLSKRLTDEELLLIGSLMMSAFTEGGIFCAKDPSRAPAFLRFYDDLKSGNI